MTALGVYVHVPWCATRCSYCDFNTYTAASGRDGFAAAVGRELGWQARMLLGARRRPAETVCFGGGTPTVLEPAALGTILDAIGATLGLAPGAEVTVEANPDSVSPATFAELRERGFTRVSLGMQSAAAHVLATLGRTHAAGRPAAAAREARGAGFEHVSLDLIYGTPGETAGDWRRSLDAALAAEPDHVSAYGLTVEPGTRLHALVRRGALAAPDDDAMADRYLAADALLGEAGLSWYELSNWARTPHARSRHNEGYWTGGDWLALGPGAHGHVDGLRWSNARHPSDWAARVERGGGAIAATERLTDEQRALERLMLRLRTRTGLPREELDAAEAQALLDEGLLAVEEDRAVLTLRGRLLGDHAIRRMAAAPQRRLAGKIA